MSWQFREAQQHFDAVIRQAVEDGPQVIMRDGAEIVVLVAAEDYRRSEPGRPQFKELLMAGPSFDDLDSSARASCRAT